MTVQIDENHKTRRNHKVSRINRCACNMSGNEYHRPEAHSEAIASLPKSSGGSEC